MLRPKLHFALLVSITVIALGGCGKKKFTSADAERIHAGMSVAEVEGILGSAESTITSQVSGDAARKETIRVYGEGTNSVVVRYDGKDQVVSVGGEASSRISTESDSGSTAAPEKVNDNHVTATPADTLPQRREAAEKGEAQAQYELGMLYMTGGGGTKDEVEAQRWLRKAADQGDARAQFQIGNMYWRAWGGLPRNDKEAAVWFRKAAEQGNADGQWQLGELYEYGRGGIRQNMAQAVSWYQKAAAQGQAQAEFALGDAYEHGKGGLRKDKGLAREWYQKSADQGYELARKKLE